MKRIHTLAKAELASLDKRILNAEKEMKWQREALQRATNNRNSLQTERNDLAEEYELLGGKR